MNSELYQKFLLIEQLCQENNSVQEGTKWSPLLLVIPLRLGLLNINPIYIDSLKVMLNELLTKTLILTVNVFMFITYQSCLQMPQSIGMIGGKPSQALYFIGYVGECF